VAAVDKVIKALAGSRYMLLTTFRRDSTPVPTPVWVVADGGSLAVWTLRDSGKVKRIRRNGKVEVAPCNVRGRPFGDLTEARAHVLPDDETQRVYELLVRKYGLQARLTSALGRTREHAAISITR
jgi:PPOX class probable F420-dependent enzyme